MVRIFVIEILKLTAKKIAEEVNGSVKGNQFVEVDTVAKIEDASSNSLCFLSNKKYIHYLKSTSAGIVLVDDSIKDIPDNLTIIRCSHPMLPFVKYLFNISITKILTMVFTRLL
jgi:UDP-3-O-[3-hydroxymyristoyl] glucosamine N-acyltransferase